MIRDGRFQVTLRAVASEWLDSFGSRFVRDRLPDAVRGSVERALGTGAWNPAMRPGASAGLSLVTARNFNALKGAPTPDRGALEALGIDFLPSEPAARANLAACLRLASGDEPQSPAGQKEFADLLSVLEATQPQLAQAIKSAVQLAQGTGQGIPGVSMPRPTSWPVTNPVVTSPFGPRKQPVPGASTLHNGVDFEAPMGKSIFSTEDGVVVGIQYNTRAGNHIFIQNHDGSLSSYSHTSPVAGLHVGQSVRAGDHVGSSNGSGNISGPHLHYVYRPGTVQNPATRGTAPVDSMSAQFGAMARVP